MSFGAPLWLWALALLPLFFLLFLGNERRRREVLEKIVAPRLLAQLAGSSSAERRRLKFGVLLLGAGLIIASLAEPRLGYRWEQKKRTGHDVFIAIDTSKSMLSTDVNPNRLARAKLAAQDLITQLKGDRAGVIAFAGDAFLQTPLTIDYNAALDSVNDLDTNTIPRGGTDIAAVINEAARAFGKGESEDRALVLFTDGEELDEDGVAAARAQAGKFRIFTVGVGTGEGSLIPLPEGGFVKDEAGQYVKSRLDEPRLKQIAEATGGFYTHLQNGPVDMKNIVDAGLGKMREHDVDERMSRQPIERYQWPLALGIALIFASMFISERRHERAEKVKAKVRVKSGMAQAALVLTALFVAAHAARGALPANQGIELYNDKKYKESYDAFNQQLSKNPDSQALEFDSGAAAYKAGEYDKAIDAFGKATTSSKPEIQEKAEYNLANALFMKGAGQQEKDSKIKDWNNALQHYDQALKLDPGNQDAKYNRGIVSKMIEELNQPPPPQQQQQQDKQDQKKQDQKNQQNQKNNDQKNQQNQQGQQNSKNDQNSGQANNQKQQPDKQNQGENSQQNPQNSNPQNSQGSQASQGGQNGGNNQQQPQNSSQANAKPGGDQKQQDQDSQQSSAGNPPQPTPGENQQESQTGTQAQNDNSNTAQNQSGSAQPKASSEPEKQYSGNIQEQSSPQSSPAQNSQGGGQQQEQAYAPGQQRQMTPTEAARVVEAEKDEEAKGVLNEHTTSAPVLRDW